MPIPLGAEARRAVFVILVPVAGGRSEGEETDELEWDPMLVVFEVDCVEVVQQRLTIFNVS